MQLPIEVERVKNARGRIIAHRATIAGFSGEGPTPRDALLDLKGAIYRHDGPSFRCSKDGAIWVAYDIGGQWHYSVCRANPSGWPSPGSSCGHWADKGACVREMERHLAQYNADLDAPGYPLAPAPACAFEGATAHGDHLHGHGDCR